MTNNNTLHAYFTAISSACASIITKFLIYPIETIKTKVQVSTLTKPLEPGLVLSLIKKTYAEEGIRGFFRGASLASIGSAPAICLYMTGYQISKRTLANYQFFKEHPSANHLISGFNAELVSCVFWLPLDIIKQRLQSQSELAVNRYKGPRQAISNIQKKEGTKALYRSYGGTLAYFGCFSMLYFTFYEKLKTKFNQPGEKPKFIKSVLMASSSGIVAGILCNPIDLAKIRIQVDRNKVTGDGEGSRIFGYRNIFDGMSKIYRKEGFFGLYKGSLVRIWTTGPTTGLIMGFTEVIRRNLKEYYQVA